MDTEISDDTLAGKLNKVGYDVFNDAWRQAKNAGNRFLELPHFLVQTLGREGVDFTLALDHYEFDRAKLLELATAAVEKLDKRQTNRPDISAQFSDALYQGWLHATLLFGETTIRTGHLLVAMLKDRKLRPVLTSILRPLAKLPVDELILDHKRIFAASIETHLRAIDNSDLAAAGAPAAASPAPENPGASALARFSQDLTAKARKGEIDPILGRDEEIRQIVDVLMRRRQNNPILTGEAGVGKTAVVEGFARALAAGEVPPALKNVSLRALDVGLLQAGASMKGEFEQRLRSVIDEAQTSPTPVILFIDEAHSLIGAGGAAGTGDAANLLKPALARGVLRTIAATTWSEYRQYFEKDPALARRFQAIHVGEPDVERAALMLRGLVAPMEKHHKVRISDEAVMAAVKYSQRYIPARQLPDKAVSLLDTAAARVAISQHVKPAMLEDAEREIGALGDERDALARERDLGADEARITAIETKIAAKTSEAEGLKAEWDRERVHVESLLKLREQVAQKDAPEGLRAELTAKAKALAAIAPDKRMIYAYVDEQAVASVVSDWTGIPVGRMVADEVETVLKLAEILKQRIVGQDHALETIAKRIETNRARLDNPNKPIGVFMLCGPSGVGKTETALALAETLYGGETNIITINMSEFQESHAVSTLKGAPPGYVGYNEGGRLTEAVRRRPYSVVLLDEVEKAHPDVHEIFFQVFDKGVMEDGSGRSIDFKNTLILLTSNVGTDIIMAAAARRIAPGPLVDALKPALLEVFPPALLGRLVTVPYYPLSPDMLAGIARLSLKRIGQRVADNHRATFEADDSAVNHIVAQCNDPDTGGRMIDNIVTNSILPTLSREILRRTVAREPIREIRVCARDGAFAYDFA